ncbi:hypothetical protein ACS0TY_021490 [Phlomoides rotata]
MDGLTPDWSQFAKSTNWDFTLEQDNGWKAYYAATRAIVTVNAAEFFRIVRERLLQDLVKCRLCEVETVTNKPKKRAPVWKGIKVPKQPDLKQCGFFVLRYMRCIFEFEGSVDMDSMLLCSKRKHTIEIKSMKCRWSGLNASIVKFN